MSNLPFVEEILADLRRFAECVEDNNDVNLERSRFDLLVQLGLLARVQRSPARWMMTQAGEDAIVQPAAGEPKPIGYISETVLQELLHGKHVPANICTATPIRRNPHPGPDANWSVAIYAAPHRHEAVRYRLLRLGEVILASDELLRDDCTTWQPMSDGPQLGIGREWHPGLVPMRRGEPVMRAQGDEGTQA